MKLLLRLVCITMLVCLFSAVSFAEDTSVFPTNLNIFGRCCTSGGEIILGSHADDTLYLYTYPMETCAEGALSTVPALTMGNAYCYDVQEYSSDTIAVLCLEGQTHSRLANIYHVREEGTTRFFTCPQQVFSICCYEQNTAYTYIDDQNRTHVVCIDASAQQRWDLEFEKNYLFSTLIATPDGIICAGYYNETPSAKPIGAAAHISYEGTLSWVYETTEPMSYSDAAVMSTGDVVLIGTTLGQMEEGCYICCINKEGVKWENKTLTARGTVLTMGPYVEHDVIVFAYRRMREQKNLTLAVCDDAGSIINQSQISADGLMHLELLMIFEKGDNLYLLLTGRDENFDLVPYLMPVPEGAVPQNN